MFGSTAPLLDELLDELLLLELELLVASSSSSPPTERSARPESRPMMTAVGPSPGSSNETRSEHPTRPNVTAVPARKLGTVRIAPRW